MFQLKKLYREITTLENKLIAEQLHADDDDDEPRFTLQARENPMDVLPDDKYMKMISNHKRSAITVLSPRI